MPCFLDGFPHLMPFRNRSELQEREENVAPELERAEDAITEARREVRAPCCNANAGLPHCMRWLAAPHAHALTH